jgi:C1A family cysteine protease
MKSPLRLLGVCLAASCTGPADARNRSASCLLQPTRRRNAPSIPHIDDAPRDVRYRTAAGIPHALDYRLSAGVVSPVKDQAACGSCWAFSATEAMEGQMGLTGNPLVLAPQTFVDCVRADDGCSGGWPDDALAYAEERGVAKESDYAYNANQTGFCRITPTDPADAVPVSARADVFYEVRANGSDERLRAALWQYGPLSVAIDASSMFEAYAGGVLNDTECQADSPNHAVLLVGYGSNQTDHRGDYWIVKNSWGARWGEDGYIRLSSSTENACGIGMYATVPSLDARFTEEEEPSMRHMRHFAAVTSA